MNCPAPIPSPAEMEAGPGAAEENWLAKVGTPGGHHLPPLTILSGILCGITQDQAPLDLVVLVALVPLLSSLSQAAAGRESFRIAMAFAIPFYALALRWYWHLDDDFGIGRLLMLYMLSVGLLATLLAVTVSLGLAWPTGRRLPFPLLFSALWILVEWIQRQPPLSMPFLPVGMRLASDAGAPFAQVAALGGPAAASVYVLVVNFLCVDMLARRWKRPAFAILVLIAVAAPSVAGLRGAPDSRAQLRVALVSTAIDDRDPKWTKHAVIAELRRLDASAPRSDLVIMPENALPFQVDQSATRRDYFEGEGVLHPPILCGAHSYRFKGRGIAYQNSAFLFGTEGRVLGRYDKALLAPVYEQPVLWGLLPGLEELLAAPGGLEPESAPAPLLLGHRPLGVLICWEAASPELGRLLRRRGAEVLINITDDTAVKETAAPYHRALRMRAIEAGLWACRCSNHGGCDVFDPRGRRRASLPPGSHGVVIADLGAPIAATPFVKWGDWPDLLAAGVVTVELGRRAWRRRIA